MPLEIISALLMSSTTGVVIQFLLEQVKEYKSKKIKDSTINEETIKKLENTLKPFKDKLDINETELKIIKKNVEKLSGVLKENGFNVTNEAYQRWTLDFIDSKFNGIRPAKSSFGMELWTEKVDRTKERDIRIQEKRYRLGDKIVLHFRAEKDCYLTLLNIGTSGKLTVLFPNYLVQNNFIRANEVYSIPEKNYPFEYQLTGPAGIEKIKAIATTSRHDLIDLDLSEKDFFHSVDKSVAARDISIVAKRIEDIPVSGWAEAMYEFEVI